MLILNMFIYKLFMKKIKNKKSSRYDSCSMYEIVEIQMHFQSNYLIFLLNFFYRCVDLGKIFKMKFFFFSFGQSMKKIIMVKVGYFCM